MPTLQQAPPTNDALPAMWLDRRLAHLALRDGKPGALQSRARPTAAKVNAEPALARLRSAGLLAKVSGRERLMIVGGTSMTGDAEMQVFEEGFMISLEPDGTFLVGVVGRGNQNTRTRASSLSDAVDAVVALHGERRSSTGASQPVPAR